MYIVFVNMHLCSWSLTLVKLVYWLSLVDSFWDLWLIEAMKFLKIHSLVFLFIPAIWEQKQSDANVAFSGAVTFTWTSGNLCSLTYIRVLVSFIGTLFLFSPLMLRLLSWESRITFEIIDSCFKDRLVGVSLPCKFWWYIGIYNLP